MNAAELGKRVKAKYPQYANVPDEELGVRVSKKYPQYKIETPSPTQPVQSNGDRVEGLIKGRESFIKDLSWKDEFNPLKKFNMAMEVGEAIPANVGLGLQRAVETKGESVKRIPRDIWKTLKGERPAQYGDIYRGAGAPESVAATGGLLASASNLTPTGYAGNKVGELLGKLLAPAGRAVRTGTGRVMSAMSGVPERSMQTALENPKVLSSRYLAKEGAAAGKEYSKAVKPLIDDPKAVVKATPRIQNAVNDLGLYTHDGETRVLSSMNEGEKKAILDWLQRADNGQGGFSFNEADKIIAEIDRDLTPMYRAAEKGAPKPTENFDRVARQIRRMVDEARKASFPDAGEAISRVHDVKQGAVANKNFDRWLPKHVVGRGALDLIIESLVPGAGKALALAQSPKMQGMAIKTAAGAGREIGSAPALTMRALAQNRKKRA